ncbi:MAG: methyl-accepting chemotaxis protein [Alphaproteobacteria bacterium]
MQFLKNLQIQTRIMLVAILPVIGILIMAGMLAMTAYSHMEEAKKLSQVAEVAPEITKVIHDLQKERGKTKSYLSATDSQKIYEARGVLEKMYETAHKHREELAEAYSHVHMEMFSEEFQGLSKKVMASLDDIEDKRKKVIARKISPKKAYASYTRHIRELINVVEYIASHSEDGELTDQFTAYSALLEAQEAMARERAVGMAVLSKGAISIHDREYVSELMGMQEAYIHVFEVYASKEEVETFHKNVIESKTFKHLKELREVFLEPEKEFFLFNQVSTMDWFGTYTKEIDLITVIENTIREDIHHHVEYLRTKSQNEMIFNVGIAASVLLLTIILLILIAKSITGPVSGLTERMKTLANDDTNFDIPDVGQGHELADMAETLGVFRENTEKVKAMEAEQEALKHKAEIERKKSMLALADDFYAKTADLISSLTMSSDGMQQTAQIMSAASEETSVSSSAVASAATEADANVQTVAAASEELAASSQEIAKQISDVASRSSTAAREAEVTSQSVKELEELAESIGEVVNAIKDIAEQTNLLALNATIEAARAGAAGKGFAVVADEVKKLANETGQKTEEIDERVNHIQDAIRNSVTAMSRIIDNVQQIDHATSSVAGAVEEQNAATAEIGRNVAEASTGTQQVSQNISEVQTAAAETGKSATDVLSTANELAEVSRGLNDTIGTFLEGIRNDNQVSNDDQTILAEAAE